MMITERSKSVIPFRPPDAKRVGEGCFYLDLIVWLNGDRIELGDSVGFNYGCYVNGLRRPSDRRPDDRRTLRDDPYGQPPDVHRAADCRPELDQAAGRDRH